MFKIIKAIFMFVGILFCGVVLFAAFHLYKAYKSGDIKSYFMKYVVGSAVDESKLSPIQQQYLETGDYESLVKDIGENLTTAQINCATEAVGEARAKDLLTKQDPTLKEVLELSKCL